MVFASLLGGVANYGIRGTLYLFLLLAYHVFKKPLKHSLQGLLKYTGGEGGRRFGYLTTLLNAYVYLQLQSWHLLTVPQYVPVHVPCRQG